MEAWNRVQGSPGGNAEGEELVHEGHEGTRSLGYQVRGVCSKCTRAASQRFVPLGRGTTGGVLRANEDPLPQNTRRPPSKKGDKGRNLNSALERQRTLRYVGTALHVFFKLTTLRDQTPTRATPTRIRLSDSPIQSPKTPQPNGKQKT